MGDAASLPGPRLVYHDQVEDRQDSDVLTDGTQSGVGTAICANRVWAIPHPPEVTVTKRTFTASRRVHLGDRRIRPGDFTHPVARHELAAVPVSLAQHQVADAGHVAGREVDVVGQVL